MAVSIKQKASVVSLMLSGVFLYFFTSEDAKQEIECSLDHFSFVPLEHSRVNDVLFRVSFSPPNSTVEGMKSLATAIRNITSNSTSRSKDKAVLDHLGFNDFKVKEHQLVFNLRSNDESFFDAFCSIIGEETPVQKNEKKFLIAINRNGNYGFQSSTRKKVSVAYEKHNKGARVFFERIKRDVEPEFFSLTKSELITELYFPRSDFQVLEVRLDPSNFFQVSYFLESIFGAESIKNLARKHRKASGQGSQARLLWSTAIDQGLILLDEKKKQS